MEQWCDFHTANETARPLTFSSSSTLTLHFFIFYVEVRVLVALGDVLGQRFVPVIRRLSSLFPHIVTIMSLHSFLATLLFTFNDFLGSLLVFLFLEFYAVLKVMFP